MGRYKKLHQFQDILRRNDFEFISKLSHIKRICSVIQSLSGDVDQRSLISEVEYYLKGLDSFYRAISGHNVSDIKKGYGYASESLSTSIKLLNRPVTERTSVSRHSLKKLVKNFLYGLSKITDGLRAAFDPDLVYATGINQDQLMRYILDSQEGLARKFSFNRQGRYSFTNRLGDLNMGELIAVEKLLVKPSNNQIRNLKGWRDVGRGGAAVRILTKKSFFGKLRVYFLYKVNEHDAYESQLNTPPDKVAFAAA